MKNHTAEIKNNSWIIRDETGKVINLEEPLPLNYNIASVLTLLNEGKHLANILFPGIFEED